jgi:hypothetical protein
MFAWMLKSADRFSPLREIQPVTAGFLVVAQFELILGRAAVHRYEMRNKQVKSRRDD